MTNNEPAKVCRLCNKEIEGEGYWQIKELVADNPLCAYKIYVFYKVFTGESNAAKKL